MAGVRGPQLGLPGRGARRLRPRRGRPAGRGGARPGLPRGGRLAEPRVARPRRRQARDGRRRQPLAPPPLDRRGRQLLAALLHEERHDRLLRPAGVGLVRRGRRGDRRALGRAGARARRAPRDVGGRGGRARRAASRTPLPMGPFPERTLRPLLADTRGSTASSAPARRVAAAEGEQVAAALDELDRVFEAVTGRAAARGDARQRRRPDGRLPRLHARPRRHARRAGARRAPDLACRRCSRLPLVVRAGVRPRRGAVGRDRASSGPLAPMLGPLMGAGFGLWDQMGDEQRELQRRWASVVAGEPAADVFGDWTPAWHGVAPTTRPTCRSPRASAGGGRARRLPRGARRLPRRRQPARPGPVRPAAPRSRRDAAAGWRGGRAGRRTSPRRGTAWWQMTARSWPLYAGGRRRRDERRRAGAARARDRVALEDSSLDDGAGHRPRRELSAPRSRSSSTCRSSSPRCAASTRSDEARRPRADRPPRRSPREHWSAPGSRRAARPTSPPGRASAGSRAASSPARRWSASPATSTSRARRCAGR